MTTKLKMSDEDLLEYVLACWNEADEVWQSDLKPIADKCWNLYRIYRDYSKKKDWQARHVNPRAFASIETATAIIKKALLSSNKFFRVDGQDVLDKDVSPLVQKAVEFHLRKAKWLPKFIESLKMAMIIGLGIIKIYWKRYEKNELKMENTIEEQPIKFFGITFPGLTKSVTKRSEVIQTVRKSELVMESVDPYKVRIDPFSKITTRPKYIMEIEEVDYSTVKKLADEDYFDKSEVEKIEDSITADDFSKEKKDLDVPESGREMVKSPADMEIPSSKKSIYRKPVVLKHFWGDIEAEREIKNGTKVQLYENYNVVVANDKFIIRKVPNPNIGGDYPYILIPCVIVPFRMWPIGLIEPISSTLDYEDDLHNFTLDAMKFDIASVFGVNLESVEDPISDLVIEPGHFIKMNTLGQDINSAIRPLTQQMKNYGAIVNMINYLDHIVQLASGVVDPLMGMITKGEQTATEYRGALSQSTIKFESIARDIEEMSIIPMIELVYKLILQNMDSGMWMEITGDDGSRIREYITPERIAGNFDFYATGITGYLYQLEYISKIVTIFSTMVQAASILQLNPEEARKVFKKIIEAHGLKEVSADIADKPMILPLIPAVKGGGEPMEKPPAEMPPENIMQMMVNRMPMGM